MIFSQRARLLALAYALMEDNFEAARRQTGKQTAGLDPLPPERRNTLTRVLVRDTVYGLAAGVAVVWPLIATLP